MIEIMTKDEFQRLMKALKPNATHRTVFAKAEIDEIIRIVAAYEGNIQIDKEMAQDIAYAMGILCASPTTIANPERCKEIGVYLEQALEADSNVE